MAYSDFTTIDKAVSAFNLSIIEQVHLFFDEAPTVEPSFILSETLNENLPLAIATGSEKARSEFIINPILVEIRKNFHRKIAIFSGETFDVDPSLGLNGVCDFLISGNPIQSKINLPVMVLVEAKKGDLKTGLGQCIAEMVAAQIFNKSNITDIIHGVVTTGTQWRFLSLKDQEVFIDIAEYPLPPVNKILGILTFIIQSHNI